MQIVTGFKIDPRKPINTAVFDCGDTNVSEAIYTVFPMDTQDAVLSWGDENIALSYRYDIGTIIDTVHDGKAESWETVWASDRFAGEWHFSRNGDSLSVEAFWRDEFDPSDCLVDRNVLKMGASDFLGAWTGIFDTLVDNLTECGYGNENLTNMDLLAKARDLLHG